MTDSTEQVKAILGDSSLGRIPGSGAIPQSKSQYKRLTAQGAAMPDYRDLARRLMEALEDQKLPRLALLAEAREKLK